MVFNLGTRKIQEYGRSLLITIPKTWVQNHDLSKGERLSLTLGEGGELVITPYAEVDNED